MRGRGRCKCWYGRGFCAKGCQLLTVYPIAVWAFRTAGRWRRRLRVRPRRRRGAGIDIRPTRQAGCRRRPVESGRYVWWRHSKFGCAIPVLWDFGGQRRAGMRWGRRRHRCRSGRRGGLTGVRPRIGKRWRNSEFGRWWLRGRPCLGWLGRRSEHRRAGGGGRGAGRVVGDMAPARRGRRRRFL